LLHFVFFLSLSNCTRSGNRGALYLSSLGTQQQTHLCVTLGGNDIAFLCVSRVTRQRVCNWQWKKQLNVNCSLSATLSWLYSPQIDSQLTMWFCLCCRSVGCRSDIVHRFLCSRQHRPTKCCQNDPLWILLWFGRMTVNLHKIFSSCKSCRNWLFLFHRVKTVFVGCGSLLAAPFTCTWEQKRYCINHFLANSLTFTTCLMSWRPWRGLWQTLKTRTERRNSTQLNWNKLTNGQVQFSSVTSLSTRFSDVLVMVRYCKCAGIDATRTGFGPPYGRWSACFVCCRLLYTGTTAVQ